MDELQRINVKFFLEDSRTLSSEEAFRIFNAWIPTTPDELLIDVADYSHVPCGPLTLLVGHEANYCLDDGQQQLGLLYARKQPLEGGLVDRLHSALAAALRACRRLEAEPDLEGRVKFRGNEFLLVANDRLHAPNSEESLQALKAALDPVLHALYKGAEFTVKRDSNPEQRFSLRIKTDAALDVSALLENLTC